MASLPIPPAAPAPGPCRDPAADLARVVRRSNLVDRVFSVVGAVLALVVLSVLALVLIQLSAQGLRYIDWSFLTSYPSSTAAKAGIKSSLIGSLLVMLVTAATAIPLGIAAAVYLEEYAKKNWFTSLIEVNIANLASVPSIIYGLMALGLLVYQFHLGHSVMTGGLTLGFLILPIIIVATREALRAIPQAIREAAFGLGASKWQTIRHHLLPYSMGGISTGVIIALSRAIGETAPLITIGALTFIAFRPPYPFEAQQWLTETQARVRVVQGEQGSPAPEGTPANAGGGSAGEAGRAPTLTLPGVIEIAMRPRSEEHLTPDPERTERHTFEIGAASSMPDAAGAVVEAIDAHPRLSASMFAGFLLIEADADVEFAITRDETRITEELKIGRGGGRAGALEWLESPFSVLPIQMFNWLSRPDPAFLNLAAATGIVLMVLSLGMNGVAIAVRARMRRRIHW